MYKIKKLISCIFASTVIAFASIPISVNSAETEAKSKLIALTFDDGPNTTTTNEVLDVLEDYHAVGSFFLIGDKINAESAKVVKRAYDMGCEIDNHSKTHSYMSEMSPDELAQEIGYVDNYVYEITGEHTKFFRPPYIAISQTMYDEINLPFICGIGCSDSVQTTTAEQRAELAISSAEDGIIILMHDFTGNSQTVEALKTIIPSLQAQGYEFVTLSELFEKKGEIPKQNVLYSKITKYPCENYNFYQDISSSKIDRIELDGNMLEQLGDSYAIEVNYTSNAYPPVVALQKWTDGNAIWYPVQPVYSNGETACFLATDILAGLNELDMKYQELDRICISPYTDEITLTNAKILVNSEILTGDANHDNIFDILDIILLQKWLLGSGNLPNWQAVDFDKDNKITIFDFILAKRALLEKLS
ncbi:MAG: polysaccharide deacetylase family protein [Oscillospiraceae bacterium]|nr:polysaccharide deacetylase family protein [Oscillospiraceae bacterium]